VIHWQFKSLFFIALLMLSSASFAEEFFPVDTPHADGWELALEEIVAHAQQEPDRTIVSTGFQESVEIAIRGFPVLFASQKPALAKSFEKLIDIARQESDFNMFLRKLKETFTDGRKPTDMRVISGIDSEGRPLFVISNESQRPQNKTVDRFIENLDRYSQQDFDRLRKSISEGQVRAEAVDWFHPRSGMQLTSALNNRRASVFYASDTVREALIESGYGATDASSMFHQNAFQVLAETSRSMLNKTRLESLGVHSQVMSSRSHDPHLFYLHERKADRESFARIMGRDPSDSEALILRGGKSRETEEVPLTAQLTQKSKVGDLINRRVIIQRKGSKEPALTGLLLDVQRKSDQAPFLIQVLVAYPSNKDSGHSITQVVIDLNQTDLKLADDATAQHLERTRISFHQDALETSIPISNLIGKKFTLRSRKTGQTEEIRLHGFIDIFHDRQTQSTFLIARAAYRLGSFVLIDTTEHIIQGPLEAWEPSQDSSRRPEGSEVKGLKTCSLLISRLISILRK
jgi:hypothetical protein